MEGGIDRKRNEYFRKYPLGELKMRRILCYNKIADIGIYYYGRGGFSMYTYKTSGVCSQKIDFDIVDGKVHNVRFTGGCNGNLQGIGRLIEGMDVHEAISRLEGVRCGMKPTSCPDQLARALKEHV